MNTKIPISMWQEGEKAAAGGKVRKLSSSHVNGRRRLEAHVDSAFNFVHCPVAEFDEKSGLVTRFWCDCWECAGGTKLCSHVVALLAKVCGEERPALDVSAADNRRLQFELEQEKAKDAPAEAAENPGKAKILEQRQEGGLLRVKGKVYADFGFVHKPEIVLEQGRIVEYSCDCYAASESAALCPHGELLYHNWLNEFAPELPAQPVEPKQAPAAQAESEEQPEGWPLFAEEEEPPMPEPEPEEELESYVEHPSMDILLGHEKETEKKLFWRPNDTEQLVHINTGVIGTMGTGKTQMLKSLITQLYRQQRNNFDGGKLGLLIFDYKGDYNETKEDFVRATNARVLKPHKLPFNPLSLHGLKHRPNLPFHVASAFTSILAKIYHLGPVQVNTLLTALNTAYERCGITADEKTWNRDAPTLAQVYRFYEKDARRDSLFQAMYALNQYEVFEPEPYKVSSLFDLLEEGVVVLDLHDDDALIQNLVVAITLEVFANQMHNAGSSRHSAQYRQLTKLILVDEADNIMSENFRALKTILKEGREFGVGTILSTQSLKHFGRGEEDYASYVLTWLVHKVTDIKRADAEYLFKVSAPQAERIARELAFLPKHESLVKIGDNEPTYMQDLAFWQIAGDMGESYLTGPAPGSGGESDVWEKE